MSVVTTKVYNNGITIAADSIICYGDSKRTTNFAKIVKINDIIIGSVGYTEESSLMWHYIRTHNLESAEERDVLAYIVEFAKYKNSVVGNAQIENEYLLAYKGHVFQICGLFVCEIKDYFAIGAGRDFATAALYLGHTPYEAVEVACKLSCWVSEPIIEYRMVLEEGQWKIKN